MLCSLGSGKGKVSLHEKPRKSPPGGYLATGILSQPGFNPSVNLRQPWPHTETSTIGNPRSPSSLAWNSNCLQTWPPGSSDAIGKNPFRPYTANSTQLRPNSSEWGCEGVRNLPNRGLVSTQWIKEARSHNKHQKTPRAGSSSSAIQGQFPFKRHHSKPTDIAYIYIHVYVYIYIYADGFGCRGGFGKENLGHSQSETAATLFACRACHTFQMRELFSSFSDYEEHTTFRRRAASPTVRALFFGI